ncbi:MAG: hypothetical protein Q9M94_00800 [Candidatus Gracilibacteria bacterium]|nr:hypothetical protein [Candidatus Gracilibacteria bacterium]
MITKTKIKKVTAIVAVAALTASTLGGAYAATSIIGGATVTGSGALAQDIIFDDVTEIATSSVAGIKVTASIAPALNMVISADEIALGDLIPGVESSGTLNLEVGTNAVSGVQITARSSQSGLLHEDGVVKINSDTTNESYKFSSTNTIDSTVSGFTSTGDLTALEVNDNTTEHQIYFTNKPEIADGNNDVTFTVSAKATSEAAYGNYEDQITFTVTGNF